MKRIVYLIITFLLIHMSCQKNPSVGVESVVDVNLSFLLPDYSEESAVVQTRTEVQMDIENRVTDVWLLQFQVAASGKKRKLIRKRYISRVTVSASGNTGTFATALTAKISQELYLIANTGDPNLYASLNASEDQFADGEFNKFKAIKVKVQTGVESGKTNILKRGVLKGTIEEVDEEGRVKMDKVDGYFPIRLDNLYAKVIFNYSVFPTFQYDAADINSREWFKVTKVTLKLPSKATTFPDIRDIEEIIEYVNPGAIRDSTITIEATAASAGQCIFYMPEMIGGITNYATHASEKMGHRVGDVLSGVLETGMPLSYIDLEGEYFVILPEATTGADVGTTYDVSYKIYLGEGVDHLNNYNVRANRVNTVDVLDIHTIYPNDDRITLTKQILLP